MIAKDIYRSLEGKKWWYRIVKVVDIVGNGATELDKENNVLVWIIEKCSGVYGGEYEEMKHRTYSLISINYNAWTTGMFLNQEVYTLSISTLIVCCSKLRNCES